MKRLLCSKSQGECASLAGKWPLNVKQSPESWCNWVIIHYRAGASCLLTLRPCRACLSYLVTLSLHALRPSVIAMSWPAAESRWNHPFTFHVVAASMWACHWMGPFRLGCNWFFLFGLCNYNGDLSGVGVLSGAAFQWGGDARLRGAPRAHVFMHQLARATSWIQTSWCTLWQKEWQCKDTYHIVGSAQLHTAPCLLQWSIGVCDAALGWLRLQIRAGLSAVKELCIWEIVRRWGAASQEACRDEGLAKHVNQICCDLGVACDLCFFGWFMLYLCWSHKLTCSCSERQESL